MKIVHVASEMFPYVKTGGLADAVGALASTLAARGHEVAVFLPGYRAVLEHPHAANAERVLQLSIEMGDRDASGDVRCFSPQPGLTIYTICREEAFDRRGLYGNGDRDYEDNDARYIFFGKAVVEAMRLLGMQVDFVHGHDWQAGLLPVLLRFAEQRHGTSLAMRTAFTIHNIAFQGIFPLRSFALTNLPDEILGIDGLEYYHQMSCMKAGIVFADKVTTVSERYAQEIQTPEFGCGLEGVVATRVADLSGLLNGIDPAVWNPATDAALPMRYNAGNLAGKASCRDALLRATGLQPAGSAPVFGMVARLTEQKGAHLLMANRDFFLREDVRLVVLGKGDRALEAGLAELAAAAPHKVHLCARLDEPMSHLVEAGSDYFLMPSLFEPCGLNQMYSQIYGAVPLVSRVGGLIDTVSDVDADLSGGTGIMFPPTTEGLRTGMERALALWSDQSRYRTVQQRCMHRDFSWSKAATAYEQLYTASLEG